MYLLIQAFPERPMTFVVTDNYGLDKDMKIASQQQVLFTNFAHTVDKVIAEEGISDVVLYGPKDFTQKLADYISEDFSEVNIRMVASTKY